MSHISGEVVKVDPPNVVIDVHGVGFVIFCSSSAILLCESDSHIRLQTHMIVREDDISLYGFSDEDERRLFVMMLRVQRLGPRNAMSLLSIGKERLVSMIQQEDKEGLIGAPGIGLKLAQKIIIDLKDKLKDFAYLAGDVNSIKGKETYFSESAVFDALLSLGFAPAEARNAINAAGTEGKLDHEGLLKKALAILGRRF